MLTKRLKTESVKRMPSLLPSLQKRISEILQTCLECLEANKMSRFMISVKSVLRRCISHTCKLVLKPDHLAGRYVVTDNAAERGGNPCAVLEALPLIFGSVVDKQVEWCMSE